MASGSRQAWGETGSASDPGSVPKTARDHPRFHSIREAGICADSSTDGRSEPEPLAAAEAKVIDKHKVGDGVHEGSDVLTAIIGYRLTTKEIP